MDIIKLFLGIPLRRQKQVMNLDILLLKYVGTSFLSQNFLNLVEIKNFPSRAYPRALIRAHQILILQCVLEHLMCTRVFQGWSLPPLSSRVSNGFLVYPRPRFQLSLSSSPTISIGLTLDTCTRNALGLILIWTFTSYFFVLFY